MGNKQLVTESLLPFAMQASMRVWNSLKNRTTKTRIALGDPLHP